MATPSPHGATPPPCGVHKTHTSYWVRSTSTIPSTKHSIDKSPGTLVPSMGPSIYHELPMCWSHQNHNMQKLYQANSWHICRGLAHHANGDNLELTTWCPVPPYHCHTILHQVILACTWLLTLEWHSDAQCLNTVRGVTTTTSPSHTPHQML